MSGHWTLRGRAVGTVALEVHPHPRGPWLVRMGRRVLAVPPDIGRILLPLHGSRVEAAADRPRACAAAGAPRLSVVVLPAALVRRVAGQLGPLASTGGLAFSAAAGLVTVACLRPWAGPLAPSPAALALFVAGAAWHELGHAAALRREGYAPGPVGAGLLICVPVLYADVSAVRLLPRAGRLRVDLAGLAFQAGTAGLLALAAGAGALPAPAAVAARTAAVATLPALAWALLPLPRSDGAWALRDALAADALAGDGPASPGPVARRLGAALTVAQWALAGLACRLLPARLVAVAARLAGAAGHRPPRAVLATMATGLTLVALGLWARGAWRAWRRRAGRA